MNEHDILKQLQELKKLKPDEIFCVRSLSLILKTQPAQPEPRGIFITIRRGCVDVLEQASLFGVVAFLLVLGIATFYFLGDQSPFPLPGINPATIIAEAESINIHIDLPELNYRGGEIKTTTKKQSAGQVISPLKEASTDAIDRLLEELSK